MRQRLQTQRGISIAICLMACTTTHGSLAAQTDRLVLTESSRHLMPANIVVHGGALSPRGAGSLFWSSDTVWSASPERPDVRRICPEMVHAPLGAAFMGDGPPTDPPVVEIVDGGVEGTLGPRLIQFSNGIDVPFGILDTAPDREELLAVRRTDHLEILTYRWSWQASRATNEPERRE
ncbi:hypothetical protein [Candidatus Palauibacter sp.]|uniref:hypothetical protein n=1 Tax=Candidatus Palauibacter sp. TaxID=3101350 RepID=UPI003B5165CD